MTLVTLPVVKMLLVAIMFLGILVEIKTGGMGAGVLLGIVAAGVFWGSQYVEGAVSFYMIAVFLGGILCIVVEMLLPTVGLLAGVGIAAMLALGGDVDAILAMLGAVVIAAGIFALIVKKLPSSKLWNRFVLHDQSTSKRGFVSAQPRTELVGRTGIVTTELRPSGTADIDGKPVDVVSEGAFLPKGTQIRVVTVEGARVVVRKS